ncbi:hypothetical protein [Amycolatopsis magusensis]|uniref:hypothetical protein n=1 Tax=Amycolatopsis magusensis TaxID=882444 RepID=UPI001AE4F2A4|nr:hypothetical protein [Amycolatopsis magusensis]
MATLIGVMLGGWLTTRNQERLWRREHARHWRDIRLSAYNDFLLAYRQYVVFAVHAAARTSASQGSEKTDGNVPHLDESVIPYEEKLEASAGVVRLVSERQTTPDAAKRLVLRSRQVVAATSDHPEQGTPGELIEQLSRANEEFVTAARLELGLSDG